MQPMTFAGTKEPPDLFFCERVHLPPSRAWDSHGFGRIPKHQTP
jgi:hypothetical protein